jgi:hypothetical protein
MTHSNERSIRRLLASVLVAIVAGGGAACGSSLAAQNLGEPATEARSSNSRVPESKDAPDTACAGFWTTAPVVDSALAVPDGGGGLLLHTRGGGTQNYACQAVKGDGGTTYAWSFVAPEANLNDCPSSLVVHHFASDAGPSAPEWQTGDGTYVIGQKVHAVTPDGGAGSVPWLLLQAVAHGGNGTLSKTNYIQRLNTDGGVAPTDPCSATEHLGKIQKVPYGADYYFYGP